MTDVTDLIEKIETSKVVVNNTDSHASKLVHQLVAEDLINNIIK